MHDNEQLIYTFYQAFSKKDAATMAGLYADDARFSDAVFVDLNAREVRAMWQMLIQRGKDLVLEFSGVQADATTGRAHWEAWYTFSGTGRKVHNVIDASFRFANGRIIEHRDQFNFWRWSRMALGVPGVVLGWTPFLLHKVQRTARSGLNDFMAKNSL